MINIVFFILIGICIPYLVQNVATFSTHIPANKWSSFFSLCFRVYRRNIHIVYMIEKHDPFSSAIGQKKTLFRKSRLAWDLNQGLISSVYTEAWIEYLHTAPSINVYRKLHSVVKLSLHYAKSCDTCSTFFTILFM